VTQGQSPFDGRLDRPEALARGIPETVNTEPSLDVTAMLDPDVAALLSSLPSGAIGLTRSLSHDSVQAVRSAFAQMRASQLTDAVERSDHVVDDVNGVTVRVHRPKGFDGDLPCLFWMHGGGLVLGSAAVDDERFDRWCPMFGIIGVSVDYRLAPETPYPGPLEDCYSGLRWVHDHCADLGIDASWIGVGGASAGGGLAAGLSLLARDRGELAIAGALLIYPMLDDRATTVSSTWDDPMWSPSANRYGWTAYLGDARGGPDVPPYAAAARATDVAGLPPTFIGVGGLDVLSDESIDFAVRLRHAGVPVELHVYPGAPHGFDAVTPTAPIARRAKHDQETWLDTQLRRRTAVPPSRRDAG
jgi:acetyl esterase/lipase